VSAPVAARPSVRPRASSADVFSRRLVLALDSVTRGQHPNGEMLSFRRDRDGNYTYVRSPFVSTFVHDALACLDPTSPGWLDDGLDLFPRGLQSEVAHAISELRRRIRSFLMWQQDAAGYWRFFGRGSGIDPDVNSTACASLALLEGHGVRTLLRWERQQELVGSFRSTEGPFFTFLKPRRGGYGWLNDDGMPVVGFDPVVNAEVFHYLSRVGAGQTPPALFLGEWLLGRLAELEDDEGSPLYPNPVCLGFVLSRALADPAAPVRDPLRHSLLARVLRQQRSDGGFGSPLSTAMGASTLLALGHRGAELEAARLAVLRGRGANDAWGYEDFVVHGFGAPAWSTALSIAFLVRHHCLAGGEPA
jgi:hypothetical protein